MEIRYQPLHHPDELEQVVDLEIEIWGLSARDAVPANLLRSASHNGALVLGAFDGRRIVGMVFAYPSGQPGKLWSHMAGVHPDYQGLGIGFQLKLEQRTWALAHRYHSISWTFDPLQRGNANFNIHKLQATAFTYHVNYYGVMTDSINTGLASDRIEATWKLNAKPAAKTKNDHPPFILHAAGDEILRSALSPDETAYRAEIPYDLQQFKQNSPDLARLWQLQLRETLLAAFEQGYSIEDFETEQNRCWYLLKRGQPWFMYVVECADKTLYTGVTNNIERRLRQHNLGKGAAYTASRRPVTLLACWQFTGKSDALKAEAQFKRLKREAKIQYVMDKFDYKKGQFFRNL